MISIYVSGSHLNWQELRGHLNCRRTKKAADAIMTKEAVGLMQVAVTSPKSRARSNKNHKSSSTTLSLPPFSLCSNDGHDVSILSDPAINKNQFPQMTEAHTTVTKKRKQQDSRTAFEESLQGVVRLLHGRKNVIVLVGAGISVSCGIPDFRSKGSGLYSTLDIDALGLSCPEELFDYEFFQHDPGPFFKFARHLYFPLDTQTNADDRGEKKKDFDPNLRRSSRQIKQQGVRHAPAEPTQHRRVEPSDSHKLLALLEQNKMLLRVYTQNIDGLETTAGVSSRKMVYAHGSLKWAKCCKCQRKVDSDHILPAIEQGRVPRCQATRSNASSPSSTKMAAIHANKRQNNKGSFSRVPSSVSSLSSSSAQASNSDATSNFNSPRRKRQRTCASSDHEQDLQALHQSSPLAETQDVDAAAISSPAKTKVCGGVFKPGVTFFGETLNDNVGRCLESDKKKVDALIVIGTSLSV